MSIKTPEPKIVVILGPTGSGKSALAVKLAKGFNGEVISADSRQVYRGLDIGSAKITKTERRGVPHHLLDVSSPRRLFTAATFQRHGRKVAAAIIRRGHLPIICGGTGFYIDALLTNTDFPAIKPNFRLRQKLAQKPAASLFKQLSLLDPARAAVIDPNNKHRLIRALEIIAATKQPVPSLTSPPNTSPFNVLKIGLAPPLKIIEQNIARRTNQMLRRGLLREIKNLRLKLSWRKIMSLGLVYHEVASYLQNQITRVEMINLINLRSRQYAKRQLTWWRRQTNIHWLKNPDIAVRLVKKFLK